MKWEIKMQAFDNASLNILEYIDVDFKMRPV